ncbi:MAG: LicD family protein [Sarcina sp.]|nr:LicD family protein [Sarcina sp.]
MGGKTYDAKTLAKLQEIEKQMFRDFIALCEKHGLRYFVIAGTAIGTMRDHDMIPWDDDIDVGMLREDYEKFLKAAPEELGEKYLVNGPDTPRTYYNLIPNLSLKGTRFIIDLAKDRFEIGIFMDIFVFENIPDDPEEAEKLIRKTQRLHDLYVLSNLDYFRFLKNVDPAGKLRYLLCGCVHRGLKLCRITPEKIYRRYKKQALKYTGKTNTYTILGDPAARLCVIEKKDLFPLKKAKFGDIEVSIVNDCDKMLRRRFGDYMQVPPPDKRVNHRPAILDFGKYAEE